MAQSDMHHPSLRHVLMSQTRDLHELLDHGIGDFGTLDDYRRYLSGSYAFRAALEPALQDIDGWQPQPLAQDLRADLADLGLAVPMLPAAPRFGDVSDLAGACYVIEGSALGARLLVRRAAALGLDAQHGARHLHAQTTQSGRWGRFLAWLETSGAVPDRAAAAAKSAFGLALTAYGLEVRA